MQFVTTLCILGGCDLGAHDVPCINIARVAGDSYCTVADSGFSINISPKQMHLWCSFVSLFAF